MTEAPLPQGTDIDRRGRPQRQRPASAAQRSADIAQALRNGPEEAAAPRPRPDKPRIATLPPSERAPAPAPRVRAVRKKAVAAVVRPMLPPRPAKIEDLDVSLTRALGARQAGKARADLDAAARAYEHERYTESLRLMARLSKAAPDIPEVRELHGLSLYRMGRWPAAIVELEAFRVLSGTAEQNAVLADCYRALRRWSDVDELWEELRDMSPNPEAVNEGRIVAAGALADRGELGAALALLEKGWRIPSRPMVHHLRRAYAMADLYERSGSPVRARELFRWVRSIDPEFSDIADRIRQLG